MEKFSKIVNWFILVLFIVMVADTLITEGWNGQVASSMYILAGMLVILSHMELIAESKIEEE